jgi:hypothetical protein
VRTFVQLGNCNCFRCLNAMMHRLREHPLVRTADLDATMGCLVVYHDCEDANTLITVVRHDLHGWELASNGEVVGIDLDVRKVSECRRTEPPR